ncbi:MAG TPA: hypothetical protein VKM94_15560 [Blastocatellia bacterium]|nr:hypothetical protein [Blastocatellia bacterium]
MLTRLGTLSVIEVPVNSSGLEMIQACDDKLLIEALIVFSTIVAQVLCACFVNGN